MSVELKDIREGSIVMVRGDFGSGNPKRATVTEVDDDIKNGRAGIDYITNEGEEHWAYLEQVDRVINF